MQGCAIIHSKCSDCNHRRPLYLPLDFHVTHISAAWAPLSLNDNMITSNSPAAACVRNYPAKNAESFEQARIILGNWISRFLLSSSHHPKPWRPHDFNFWGGGDHPAKNSCMYVVLPWVGDGIRVVSKYYYSMILVTYR